MAPPSSMDSADQQVITSDGDSIKHARNGNGLGPKSHLAQPFPTPERSALVLYGSETGNAHDVAEEIGRVMERFRFDTTVIDLDSVQLKALLRPTVVVFIISTTGQGEVPQNARAFWQRLLSSALKPGVLRRLHFTSFGLGDSSYPHFNLAHRAVCARLVQLGARAFCERGEGNEQHSEGHSAGLREWLLLFKRKLTDVFPLPAAMDVIPDDVFVEPPWKLQALSPAASPSRQHPRNDHDASLPAPALMPLKDAFPARIESNDRVTTADHFQDVRLLDLRIDALIDYSPGAVAVIHPKNFPEDVQQFIEMMAWTDIADRPLQLVGTSPHSLFPRQSSPSPLRQFDTGSIDLTLRWLLENVLDIMSIPRRTFFATLAYFARSGNEDENYQKERLLELANPELIDELWDYTTRPRRTILEVMMDFTTIKIPWQYALSTLPIMRGRQFSIASGGALKVDDQGQTRIQLLIAIVHPPSPIIKWRRRYGVCTRYVAVLAAGMRVNVGLQRGYLAVEPTELNVPVVLVGPGTGLAPMRAMIHERLAWAKRASSQQRTAAVNTTAAETDVKADLPCGKTATSGLLKSSVLFFGCRSSIADFFFVSELTALQREHGLQLHVAFSRDADPTHRREYVQDRIRACAAAVHTALTQQNGKVYVCGSSGNMPKGVRQAIVDVLVDGGASGKMLLEDAEAFVAAMEKNGRYKQETW